ncbi:MAG: three-Cys-motif partner protein TcmP [Pirellulales bacterium]|nr:three-Cys-motif partner protein TcmP [Pirellulales bacterium]
MSHEHHDWKPGSDPPLIRPHSQAKHRVLRAYLERYVSVLTVRIQQDTFRLTLIDGFAGGGLYLDSRSKEERPGSPLIMLEAMEQAAEDAQKIRTKPFHLDVQYIFIEKDRKALDYLRQVLSESKYASLVGGRIELIHGEFTAQVPKITAFVKKRGRAGRAIFVLDQFGYSAVPLPTIRGILATLDNAEVILTFATDSLIDYLSENEPTQKILEKVGITLPSKNVRTAKEEREWRRTIQFALHREIPVRTEAKFYTPFFIRSTDAHRDFWLIHLSGHFRARDVMVGLHWKQGTSFAHYGRSGLRMLGYDQEHDAEWTQQQMLPGFFFDETALVSSQEELLEQLPERIFNHSDGIQFTELFSNLTNECPVTAEIMKDVLSDLAKQGVIQVKDKTGAKSRRVGIQHDSDIIIPTRQMRLFLR